MRKDRHVVAVIGDGSMSGGLAFEGLNNASSTNNNLLIILNDNDMAIDRSVGGMKQYLFNLTTSNRYNQLRFKASKMLFKMGVLNEDRRKALIRFSNSLKSMAAQQQNIFEGMNIRYFGPINGHDVKNLARILRDIKDLKGPKILHLHTVKGKGFEPAEKTRASGMHRADSTPKPESASPPTPATCPSVPNRVRRDAGRTGREKSEDSGSYSCHAHRMLHEPIDEVHARSCIRCRHCRRACSHILRRHGKGRHAALLQHLLVFHAAGIRQCDTRHCPPEAAVVLCLDRAGLVGEDGPTHHGVYDLAYFRPIPNLTISSPMDEHELRRLMYTAQLPDKGPFVIRYPPRTRCTGGLEVSARRSPRGQRAQTEGRKGYCRHHHRTDRKHCCTRHRTGRSGKRALHSPAHDLRFLKPLDEALLHEAGRNFKRIVTIEDGTRKGGMGSAVLEFMADNNYTPHVERIGVPDAFIEHGTVQELHQLCGMDEEGIYNILIKNEE